MLSLPPRLVESPVDRVGETRLADEQVRAAGERGRGEAGGEHERDGEPAAQTSWPDPRHRYAASKR